jgi:glycine betaine/proline transport system substrate-binding protein
MALQRSDWTKLAKIFMKEHPEIWQTWVTTDAARKINAEL